MGPIFKGQALQLCLDCLTPENGTDCSEMSVTKIPINALRNIPEELRSHLYHSGTLKS